jgi:hypothetical protein
MTHYIITTPNYIIMEITNYHSTGHVVKQEIHHMNLVCITILILEQEFSHWQDFISFAG